MFNNRIPQKLVVLLSAAMILAGLALSVWAFVNFPGTAHSTVAAVSGAPDAKVTGFTGAAAAPPALGSDTFANSDDPAVSARSSAPLASPLVVDLGDAPASLATALESLAVSSTLTFTRTDGAAPALRFGLDSMAGEPVYQITFAAATRFDTIDPTVTVSDLKAGWAGTVPTYTQVAILSDTLPALEQLLGKTGRTVTGYATMDEVVDATWQDRTTLALVPFEQLVPRLTVLAVDGQNPLENAHHFDPTRYPLVTTVFAAAGRTDDATQAAQVRDLLAALPGGNRDAGLLTVVAMTGVTAMCRQTAEQMDRFGPAWAAEVVGPELSSADITHISNEVPFVEGCKTNTDPDNFNFCSKPAYMATLTASGVDIIGLTGNHQNDFGRANARLSLDLYEQENLPVYGGGRDKAAAFKPLIVEHNGNRLAFLGANSYGPKMAWATDSEPGAAEFDLAIMSSIIRGLKQEDQADVVLAELQYQESYDAQPLVDQRQDFTALVRAGADIVTGVQSHVPQGFEFTDGKLVLYGLGNLFFDQMWAQATREGMVVKHTIYKGRHLGTQILTTLLYDFGQPRWTTPPQRAAILDRVFAASHW